MRKSNFGIRSPIPAACEYKIGKKIEIKKPKSSNCSPPPSSVGSLPLEPAVLRAGPAARRHDRHQIHRPLSSLTLDPSPVAIADAGSAVPTIGSNRQRRIHAREGPQRRIRVAKGHHSHRWIHTGRLRSRLSPPYQRRHRSRPPSQPLSAARRHQLPL